MSWDLVLAALCTWSVGALADLAIGPRSPAARMLPYLAGLGGGGLACAAGAYAVEGHPVNANLGTTLGVGTTLVHLDPLAGLFLCLTAGLAVVISASTASWARRRANRRGAGAGYMLLLGATTLVIVAGDAFTFLFAWETLTVAFYVLIGVQRRPRPGPNPAWVTFGVGKASGAALLLGFLLLAGQAGTYTIASWAQLGHGAVHSAGFALLVLGFAAKVGVVPFQIWMPVGYPMAPGPTRAALAGLAANAGFYGLWRTLAVLGRPPLWLAVAVLLFGAVTALVGIAFAAVQDDIDRVIAYSSVENAGLIVVAYGVALAGAATGHPNLAGVGLLAGTLQVLAHAVAKSGLFTASSFFTDDYHTTALDDLRGVGHSHPWSGTTFALGALTLSGLPPTIGFVSEWFVLEALMQEFRTGSLALRLAMGTAGALVAVTTGVAALTFVRLLGLSVLGRPQGSPLRRASIHDGGALGRAGMSLLALACVGLAAVAPWTVRFLADGLGPVVPRMVTTSALKSPWVLQPVYRGFSILSPSWLVVVLPVGCVAVLGLALLLSRGSMLRARRVPAWRSATTGVSGADRYTSFGYSNVLRHVLGNVLGSRRETVVVEPEEGTNAVAVETKRFESRSSVVEPAETYLYGPGRKAFLALAGVAKRLQSGRLDAYIAYMLVALVAVLIVAIAV